MCSCARHAADMGGESRQAAVSGDHLPGRLATSMATTLTCDYVTICDAHPRSGWLVMSRQGSSIVHKRLNAPKHDVDAARAEAQAMFPDRLVVAPGDPKPWATPSS